MVTGSTGTRSEVARRKAPGLKRSTLPVWVRSPSGKIMTTWPAWSRRTASRVDAGSVDSMRTGNARSRRINQLNSGISNSRLQAM